MMPPSDRQVQGVPREESDPYWLHLSWQCVLFPRIDDGRPANVWNIFRGRYLKFPRRIACIRSVWIGSFSTAILVNWWSPRGRQKAGHLPSKHHESEGGSKRKSFWPRTTTYIFSYGSVCKFTVISTVSRIELADTLTAMDTGYTSLVADPYVHGVWGMP